MPDPTRKTKRTRGPNLGRDFYRALDTKLLRLGAPKLVWHSRSQGTARCCCPPGIARGMPTACALHGRGA